MMAIMIPDRCPTRASKGEKRLFAILQNLPDTDWVYYEPIIENRYPDFVVLAPTLGMVIIEVKGWRPGELLGGDMEHVSVKETHGVVRHAHPIRQARSYMFGIIDRLKDIHGGARLLARSGDHQNRLVFPMAHFAVLSNITADQLTRCAGGDLTALFPADTMLFRDQLLDWENEAPSGDQLRELLKGFFDPFWTIEPLDPGQIDVVRAALHPEVVLSGPGPGARQPSATAETTNAGVNLKVLDARQEANARSIGSGHRIIYGVAGSGKTVLLVAKARLLAAQQPEHRILVVCFNVSLSSYLKNSLAEHRNITVLHFHGWARANGVSPHKDETHDAFGRRLQSALASGQAPHCRLFQTIMVDEAQDFEPVWFQCLLEAMQDPDDGDLIIVGDGSQGLYGDRRIVWRDLGIHAQGRTISKHFDLHTNYRNSREILELAAGFSVRSGEEESEDTLVALHVDPATCKRSTGVRPRLLRSATRGQELERSLQIVKGLLDGRWFGQDIEPLGPADIAIFYPYAAKRDRYLLSGHLLPGLEQLAPSIWLTGDPDQRRLVGEAAIKLCTIHASKGLQFRAVILIWADLLPRPFEDVTEAEDRKLLYVALTRPEDYLAITASGPSVFLTEIEQSGKAVIG